MRACVRCGFELNEFYDPRALYCSDICKYLKRAEDKKQGPWKRTCEICQIDFLGSKPNQKFCSAECRYEGQLKAINEKYRAFRAANPIPDFFEYTCDICQKTFTKPHRVTGIAAQRGVYCEDCRVVAQQARYRKKTVVRQASTVKPSGAWHEQILEAHGSICYLCDEEIDMTIPRTSKMGATVDHVTPLSRGGSDEIGNLRLAHWICNRRKSNKLVEEL